jgi:hypothetical protein
VLFADLMHYSQNSRLKIEIEIKSTFFDPRVIQSLDPDPKNRPRWQTVRAARDENALKLVQTEKLSSFFLLSVRQVLAVDK